MQNRLALSYEEDPAQRDGDGKCRPSSLSRDFSYVGPHQSVKVLSLLLEDVPKERKKARGLVLTRLFKRLMTSSYFVAEWPLSKAEKEANMATRRALLKRYHFEFFFSSGNIAQR